MQVNGFENCPANNSTLTIYPSAPPQINLPLDTIAGFDMPVVLDASSKGAASWLWLPVNESGPTLTVDTTVMDRGSKSVFLQITNQNGCIAEQMIRVHFPAADQVPEFTIYPNPCKDYFTIEPENGTARFQKLSLYNSSGTLVWQKDGDISILNRQDFSLPSLAPATYFLVASNAQLKRVKELVIR